MWWWWLISHITSVVPFRHLLATAFSKTHKSFKKSRVEYYWCILCHRIKLENILSLWLIIDHISGQYRSRHLGNCLGRNQLRGRRWAHILALHFSRVVIKCGMATLKYDCLPPLGPHHHWARVLSFWIWLYAIGPKHCQLLPLIVSCKVCIWSTQ